MQVVDNVIAITRGPTTEFWSCAQRNAEQKEWTTLDVLVHLIWLPHQSVHFNAVAEHIVSPEGTQARGLKSTHRGQVIVSVPELLIQP